MHFSQFNFTLGFLFLFKKTSNDKEKTQKFQTMENNILNAKKH